jgi:hypothetical protein
MKEKNQSSDNSVPGLSLTSFLQILEQEQKTCSLHVSTDKDKGVLYFQNGEIIDAKNDSFYGEEALFSILKWKNTHLKIADAEKRKRRINKSLTHILLRSADQQDSASTSDSKTNVTAENGPLNPLLAQLISIIKKNPGIQHYYLLNRKGITITQSSKNQKMGNFIAYAVITGAQIKNNLNVKGPSRIVLTLNSGQNLLIFPGAGIIIGLLLKENISVDDVFIQIRSNLQNNLTPAR